MNHAPYIDNTWIAELNVMEFARIVLIELKYLI